MCWGRSGAYNSAGRIRRNIRHEVKARNDMVEIQRRRITLAPGASAGGLLVGTFLPMAVAFADDTGWAPDPSTLNPTDVSGFPPWSPEVITGHEAWSRFDFTTNTVTVPDQLDGVDTETIFGAFTNDDFSNGGVTI